MSKPSKHSDDELKEALARIANWNDCLDHVFKKIAVARTHNRQYIGCELNPDYVDLANKRLAITQLRIPA